MREGAAVVFVFVFVGVVCVFSTVVEEEDCDAEEEEEQEEKEEGEEEEDNLGVLCVICAGVSVAVCEAAPLLQLEPDIFTSSLTPFLHTRPGKSLRERGSIMLLPLKYKVESLYGTPCIASNFLFISCTVSPVFTINLYVIPSGSTRERGISSNMSDSW